MSKPFRVMIAAGLIAVMLLTAQPAATDGSGCLPTIGFDTDAGDNPLAAGTIVAEQWAAWGVHITTNDPGNHPVMIFDSSNPTGGDTDLGTPNGDFGGPGVGDGGKSGTPGENSLSLGKILIISEDGDQSDPDDNGGGGTITFTFDQDMRVDDVHILDIDNNESAGTVTAYDASGTEIVSRDMQALGDNSFQVVEVNATGVRELEIYFPKSGGVPAIVFCRELGSIGDRVWYDSNNDGQQDAGEVGINGVTVNLRENDCNGNIIDTAETSGDGNYLFTGLAAGDYCVEVEESTLPVSGYSNTTANNPTTVALSSGESDFDVDFGYRITAPCLPSIDFDTDAYGDSLTVGEEIAEQWAAWGVHVAVSPNGSGDGPVIVFDSANPTCDTDLGTPNEDFGGPGIGTGGGLGQAGENSQPLGKVMVIKENASCQPNDSGQGGTITFSFDQPMPVDDVYVLDIDEVGSQGTIEADTTSGGTVTKQMSILGENSFQAVPVNATDVTELRINFPGSGGVPAIVFCREEGSLGDYVWIDESGDGEQGEQWDGGPDEVGINDVELELWLDDGDGVFESGEDTKETTMLTQNDGSGNPGWYLFTGLNAGTYFVRIAPQEFDSGGTLYYYNPTEPNKTGVDDALDSDGDNPTCPYDPGTDTGTCGQASFEDNILAMTTLGAGAQDLTIDFGVLAGSPPTAVTLSSFVAMSSAGYSANWLWLGLAGVAVLAAGSLFWTKR